MMAAKIYPEIWDRADDGGHLDYLVDYFEVLKRFISEAAEKRMGIILSLC